MDEILRMHYALNFPTAFTREDFKITPEEFHEALSNKLQELFSEEIHSIELIVMRAMAFDWRDKTNWLLVSYLGLDLNLFKSYKINHDIANFFFQYMLNESIKDHIKLAFINLVIKHI